MRLTLACFAVIVAATLAPFEFVSPPRHAFQYGAYQRQGEDVAANVVLFMPFGAALHRAARRRSLGLSWSSAAPIVVAVLISFGIEYTQAFIPGRDSSLVDVLANTAGAGLGVVVAWQVGRFGRDPSIARASMRSAARLRQTDRLGSRASVEFLGGRARPTEMTVSPSTGQDPQALRRPA